MNLAQKRKILVEEYIKPVGITDKRLIDAFLRVPRYEFVVSSLIEDAYVDEPLPIGSNQVTAQPSLIAAMIDHLQLKGNEKVLEIGTGTGYQAALLSLMSREVFTIEQIRSLAQDAKKTLKRLGYRNVKVIHGDETKGYPKEAPYDAIIVAAASSGIPQVLIDQLKESSRIVIPVGNMLGGQTLKIGVKEKGQLHLVEKELVNFVPLVYEED